VTAYPGCPGKKLLNGCSSVVGKVHVPYTVSKVTDKEHGFFKLEAPNNLLKVLIFLHTSTEKTASVDEAQKKSSWPINW